MGISQVGGTNRLITKSGSGGVTALPNITGVSTNTGNTDQGYGSWTTLVASTSAEYLLTGLVARVASSVTGQYGPLIVDIGSGAPGSEAVLATGAVFGAQPHPNTATATVIGGSRDFVPIRVAASTRLAFRAAIYTVGGSTSTVIVIVQAVPYANVEGN